MIHGTIHAIEYLKKKIMLAAKASRASDEFYRHMRHERRHLALSAHPRSDFQIFALALSGGPAQRLVTFFFVNPVTMVR